MIDKDKRGDLDGQAVGDRGEQEAATAVADEDDGIQHARGGGAYGFRYVTPLRRGCVSDTEQRWDHNLAPAQLELARDRRPGRRSDERAVDQHEDRIALAGRHRCSMPRGRTKPSPVGCAACEGED
jgi:hypothetical protein